MSTSKTNWFDFIFFKEGRPFFIFIALCLFGSAILGSLTPVKISALAKNYDVLESYHQSIKELAILFFVVYVNRVFYQLAINRYVLLLMQRARTSCYNRWLHAYELQSDKESRTERYPQGEVISRIMNDTESLRELMTSGTFGIFIDLFFVFSCLFSFISLNKISGLFLTGVEIIAAILLVWGSKYMRDIFLEVRKSRGMMSRTIANVVGGVKETYYTRHENYASKKGSRVFEDFLNKILRSNIWDSGYYSVAESLYPIMLALVVLIFPYSHIVETAIIFAVVDLIQRSIKPIKDISSKIANLQRAYTGMFRIQEFLGDLDSFPSTKDQSYGGYGQFHTIEIDVKNFQYPRRKGNEVDQFRLQNISVSAKRGELLGIVGLSGCGKSTLLNIVAANILPSIGEIRLLPESDTQRIYFPGNGASDIIKYREQISLVSQDSHLFSETVAFNISLKRDHEKELQEFWEWVKKKIPYLLLWNIELDSKLNPKELSVGQKQLLAAIRSCYLKKPVVLFDEISSGLDGQLEQALREMVLIIQKNSLTVIVAHRLETLFGADKIIVMEAGNVIDIGRHEALVDKSEVYRQFLAELSHSS